MTFLAIISGLVGLLSRVLDAGSFYLFVSFGYEFVHVSLIV